MYSMCSKPGELRNALEGKVGLQEELADLPELHPPDLGLGRAADVLAELALHLAARRMGVLQDLLDRDPAAGLLADEAQGRGDVAVLDGKDVRGVPGDDPKRLDPLVHHLRGPPHEQVPHESGRAVSRLEGIRGDARKGRVRQLAADGVVIGAEDRHLLGHEDGPTSGPR